MKPGDLTGIHPWSSKLRNAESEVIARNIMVILKRTGNEWRELSETEYANERKKDGNYSDWRELPYFRLVVSYTTSEAAARSFSKSWDI